MRGLVFKKHLRKLIVITGPTASGKTALSVRLAKYFKTEIISADSRQVYKEMNIGTAKPSQAQLAEVPHHFINSFSISEEFNAGLFESSALTLLEKLFQKNNFQIMTGGSGLYLNAVLYGFDNLPSTDLLLRKQIKESYQIKGLSFLQEEIKRLDPDFAAKSDLNNPQRMMRALEACYLSGQPYSTLLSNDKKKRDFEFSIYVIEINRDEIYSRINIRVDEMVKQGLFDEAHSLYQYRNEKALQTVGYKEIFEGMDSGEPFSITVEKIKKNTRNYAKRQMTWFRSLKNSIFIPAANAFDFIIEKEIHKRE